MGYVTTLLLFFFENAKSLGWSDDAKRRKKRPHGQTLLWTQSVCINGVSILSGSYYLSQKTPFFEQNTKVKRGQAGSARTKTECTCVHCFLKFKDYVNV